MGRSEEADQEAQGLTLAYTVQIAESAQKSLAKFPAKIADRIQSKIDALAINPRPPGVKKIAGEEFDYRIRVGNYRIIYEIHDNVLRVMVITVAHRKDAYR